MALDFGDKRIGVAISDSLGITAQGKGFIKRTDLKNDLNDIKDYITEYDVSEIVVGMPRNMDGSLGKRAEKTRAFINFLENNLDIPIKIWDERLTSAEAERMLIKADVRRDKRKQVIDKLAASIILRSYLEAQKNNIGRNNK